MAQATTSGDLSGFVVQVTRNGHVQYWAPKRNHPNNWTSVSQAEIDGGYHDVNPDDAAGRWIPVEPTPLAGAAIFATADAARAALEDKGVKTIKKYTKIVPAGHAVKAWHEACGSDIESLVKALDAARAAKSEAEKAESAAAAALGRVAAGSYGAFAVVYDQPRQILDQPAAKKMLGDKAPMTLTKASMKIVPAERASAAA